jgi:glutathione synthase/RimK-type ligase-like ATP-grasp enzyme
MMTKEELQKRAGEDEKLYEQFAKQLEAEHSGKFVAIAQDGNLIVESDQILALQKAIKTFGKGNFAFRKIGSRALGKWRKRIGH